MKKITFYLTIMSILFMLFYGCSGGSNNSNSIAASINEPPVAAAGEDQSVAVGETALLSGSGSYDTDENYPLTYEWQIVSVPEGSAATLSEIISAGGSGSSQISIKPDLSGDYVIQLVVTDSKGLASKPDLVVVSTRNSAPKADAGTDQTAQINDLVTLDGGGSSDVDGDSLSFFWALITVPDGSSTLLSDTASVNPTFIVDVSGTYVAQLIVNDGMVDSAPDTVTINWENSPPVADAGENYQVTDIDGNETETVILDGSGSIDPDGTIQAYEWKEGGNVLGSSAIIVHGFSLGTHTVSLTVTDDKGATASDTALVNVLPMVEPDSVTILRAEYTRNTKQLLVEATSTQYPDATLTLEGYGIMTYSGVDSTYIFNSTVGNLKKGATVTVISNHGGADTALVNF